MQGIAFPSGERQLVEFRNHQTKILHTYRNLAGNPLGLVLFAVLFLVVLIPVLMLIAAAAVITVVLLPVRILLARLRGEPTEIRYSERMARFEGESNRGSGGETTPSGPVIDVEVTRRQPLN